MKKFLSLIVVAALGASLATVAFGQQAGPRGGGVQGGQGGKQGGAPQGQRRGMGMGMRRMADINKKIFAQLNLTADQKKKIDALQKSTDAKWDAFRKKVQAQGQNGDRQKMMTEGRKISTDHRTALMKILTPAQQKKYETLLKAEMEKLRKERGAPGAPPRGRGGAPGTPPAGGKSGGKTGG